MSFSPLIRQLIDALRILPGAGQKTAQRMALQLLERDRSGGTRLSQALGQAMEGVGHCRQCRTLTEDDLAAMCRHPPLRHTAVRGGRADGRLRGRADRVPGALFVLKGTCRRWMPWPGGDRHPQLLARIEGRGLSPKSFSRPTRLLKEATAHYIAQLLQHKGLIASRIAHGVPLGGDWSWWMAGPWRIRLPGGKPISL